MNIVFTYMCEAELIIRIFHCIKNKNNSKQFGLTRLLSTLFVCYLYLFAKPHCSFDRFGSGKSFILKTKTQTCIYLFLKFNTGAMFFLHW